MSSPLHWRKSSFSNPTDCVELAWPAAEAAIRDSKDPAGPTLHIPRPHLVTLITTLKAQS